MKLNKSNITENTTGRFFANSSPQYGKSKQEVWNELEKHIDKSDKSKKDTSIIPINLKVFYGIAATLVLLLGTTLMLRFYAQSSYCPSGTQITITLPDGSSATLQPESTITYYPFWWQFSRKVVFSGEARFDVKPGKDFTVMSPLGSTTVLGTSFNVLARDIKYIVTCYTGSVKVTSFTQRSVVLNPNYTAEILNGELKVSKYRGEMLIERDDEEMFNFKSEPLPKVIKEIEKHYGVTITSSASLTNTYTGFFSKQKTIEEALYIICKPYGLTFVVLSENKYHIIEN